MMAEDVFDSLKVPASWMRRNNQTLLQKQGQRKNLYAPLHHFTFSIQDLTRANKHSRGNTEESLKSESHEATRVREVFKSHFCEEGAVPWQPAEYSCPPQD
ncbi:hypothetical protein NQD34_013174 [Periophthalmus magnuspinnatus]|nr:hypothetical protein NQD34_013174 [Periophthalmus magnuspinnatus]